MATDTYRSYRNFRKPSWSPPAWLFGPVWTLLYVLIALSFGTVFYDAYAGIVPWLVAVPFALNLVFNFSFTWLEFGLKNMLLAAIDVLLVLATLVWALVVIYPTIPWVAYINIPYLLWVCFATTLQLTVTYLNR